MSRSPSPSTNTLIEGPGSRDGVVPEVYDVLDSPEERNLLVLSYADGPDAWLQNWRTHAGELPEEVGFVHVGVATRSSAATRSPTGRSADALAKPSFQESTFGTPPAHADPLLPDAISDPADLARLGICASEYLESWAGDDREIIVFLDSLSEMLEHVSLDRAFKFLQILTARVESVDGRGYYLVDPSAHDDTSLMPLRELVDAAVDLDCPDAGH